MAELDVPTDREASTDREMERLLEFLYVAPVGLIEFRRDGQLVMANPRVAQLFNRFAPGGYFANFFSFLDDVLPELRAAIEAFVPEHGQIMENRRYAMRVPGGDGAETLWMDVTVMRQEADRYIASLNNVTHQVLTERENYLRGQKLESIIGAVTEHAIFTLDVRGCIDSWNRTGELALGVEAAAVLGQPLETVLSGADGSSPEIPGARAAGLASEVAFRSEAGTVEGRLTLAPIRDLDGGLAGHSCIFLPHRRSMAGA
jgi:PAS domain-containing protein